jgi:hypothetical protein
MRPLWCRRRGEGLRNWGMGTSRMEGRDKIVLHLGAVVQLSQCPSSHDYGLSGD